MSRIISSKSVILAATLIGGLGVAAQAQTLKPVQAAAIDLGQTHGYAYYVAEPAGFHVVATLDTDTTPVRFGATLSDGQSASVSIPGAAGEAPIEVTFVRTADKLEVRRAALPFDAVTASTRY